MEMTSKERRAVRKNKMRISMQKKLTRVKEMNIDDGDAADTYLPEKKKVRRVKEMNDAAAGYLPEDLVIENILTRLPIRILAQYSLVSKLCCNTITNNAQFAKTHFLHNNNHKLNLVFNLLNVWFAQGGASFFSLDDDYKFRLLFNLQFEKISEPVGYCNGFACITKKRKDVYGPNIMTVTNPVRKETLSLPYYNYPTDDGECEYLCHGFGFDSSTDEYKVVIIFTKKGNEEELITMVFTLGTNSWRKSVTSVAQISPSPASYAFLSRRLVTRPATLCGGDLFWRIANSAVEVETTITNIHSRVHDDSKFGMLLSFDIHKEKIQFIRLPTEFSLTPMPTTMNVVIEHHLLEHKGYPCVARSAKIKENITNCSCHCHNEQSRVCCCCCRFVVQLYVLKDKEKQVWIKGETLGVQVRKLGLLPAPFCCYSETITAASFPMRILSVSDRVLLYWFDGKCLNIYNSQTKHLEVVGDHSSCNDQSSRIFKSKMRRSPPIVGFDDDFNIYCPYLDYQLHARAENILSLKAFIPAGDASRYNAHLQQDG